MGTFFPTLFRVGAFVALLFLALPANCQSASSSSKGAIQSSGPSAREPATSSLQITGPQQAGTTQPTNVVQQGSADHSAPKVPITEKPSPTTLRNGLWRSDSETFLSGIVLIFGVLLFIAELLVINAGKYNADQSTKLIAVTLIIVGTIFIITAGFSSNQIAPAMGLFGTVAGYLLGRSQHESK